MAEWLYEAGIGEARAALVVGERIIEAHIEPDDGSLRAGTVCMAQLTQITVPGRRGLVRVATGQDALLEPLPKGLTQGGTVRVEIVRDAIAEPGAVKRSKARVASPDAALCLGPSLLDRMATSSYPIRHLLPSDPDALETAGWSECLEDAASGTVAFIGGALRISLTPAMTLIDVDGHLPPAALAVAAARAAAAAIRRFDITGSIGVDFPTLANKAERLATVATFDSALPLPFERTSINGFGFLQVIRPRLRASLCERLEYEAAPCAARALLRRAQRSGVIGTARLSAHPDVITTFDARPEWIATLSAQMGGTIDLHADPALAIGSGYVAKI